MDRTYGKSVYEYELVVAGLSYVLITNSCGSESFC